MTTLPNWKHYFQFAAFDKFRGCRLKWLSYAQLAAALARPGGVAVNILPCQGRDRRFESAPGRHLIFPHRACCGSIRCAVFFGTGFREPAPAGFFALALRAVGCHGRVSAAATARGPNHELPAVAPGLSGSAGRGARTFSSSSPPMTNSKALNPSRAV